MQRICKEILQTVIVFFLINFPASAGIDSKTIIRYNEETQTAQFISDLSNESVKRLINLHERTPIKKLIITSPGGDFDSGIALGEFVYDNKISVVVHRYCNSSCTIAFFSADLSRRYMMPNSFLGLHNVSIVSNVRNSDDSYITVRQLTEFADQLSTKVGFLFILYSVNGIPSSLLLEVAKVRGEKVIRISKEQLYEFGALVN